MKTIKLGMLGIIVATIMATALTGCVARVRAPPPRATVIVR
jgi:hypothetical protein